MVVKTKFRRSSAEGIQLNCLKLKTPKTPKEKRAGGMNQFDEEDERCKTKAN
jgi:hypothetical protein